MVNNLLIKTLAGLSRRQVSRFQAFSQSPYFNKHSDVQQLIIYLSNTYPAFTEKRCHRKLIFKKLYPTLPHNQKKLAVVFTYAMRLLEQFLRVEEAINNGLLKDKTLLFKQLSENELLFNMEKYWQEFTGGVKQNNNNVRSLKIDGQLLEALKVMDETSLRLSKHGEDYLAKRQELFDVYYLKEKLKDGCELVQRSIIYKKEFVPSLLFVEALDLLEKNLAKYAAYPPVQIFYHLFQLLEKGNPSLYDILIDYFPNHEKFLPPDELQIVYNSLQNFCIRQINLGQTEFLRKLFEIFQSQLEKELLLVNNYLPEWHYKNIVTTALRLDEHEWVSQFIHKYQLKLRPEVRENAFSYNLASYYYYLGQYDDVLNLLLKVEYTDVRYGLDAKSLLLRTYYDTDEEGAFFPLADAFRQFLKRNKDMTEFQKKGYYNLLKFAKKAFRLKMNKRFISSNKWAAGKQKLANDFYASETVFNRGWLENKITELDD